MTEWSTQMLLCIICAKGETTHGMVGGRGGGEGIFSVGVPAVEQSDVLKIC